MWRLEILVIEVCVHKNVFELIWGRPESIYFNSNSWRLLSPAKVRVQLPQTERVPWSLYKTPEGVLFDCARIIPGLSLLNEAQGMNNSLQRKSSF